MVVCKWDYLFFREKEFDCKCGCGFNVAQIELVDKLQKARELALIPFKINCGCRCEKHNKEVGGVKDSAHVKGLAVDISARDDRTRFTIVSALLLAGFGRILLYPTFIHADLDYSKPNPILKIMK